MENNQWDRAEGLEDSSANDDNQNFSQPLNQEDENGAGGDLGSNPGRTFRDDSDDDLDEEETDLGSDEDFDDDIADDDDFNDSNPGGAGGSGAAANNNSFGGTL